MAAAPATAHRPTVGTKRSLEEGGSPIDVPPLIPIGGVSAALGCEAPLSSTAQGAASPEVILPTPPMAAMASAPTVAPSVLPSPLLPHAVSLAVLPAATCERHQHTSYYMCGVKCPSPFPGSTASSVVTRDARGGSGGEYSSSMSSSMSSSGATSPLEAEPLEAEPSLAVQVQRIADLCSAGPHAAQQSKPPSQQVAHPAQLAQLVDGEDHFLLTADSAEAFVAGLLCEQPPSPPTSPPSVLVAASSTAPSAAHPHVQDSVRSPSTTLQECDSIGCDHRDPPEARRQLRARWGQRPRVHSVALSGTATFRTVAEMLPGISMSTTFVLGCVICWVDGRPMLGFKACDFIDLVAWAALIINVPANALTVMVREADDKGCAAKQNDHIMACSVWVRK